MMRITDLCQRTPFLYLILSSWMIYVACKSFTCEKFYSMKYDVWLYGEAPPIAFPTQLLAVYSFAPTALLLQTSLVLGMFTVHEPMKSADLTASSHEWKAIQVPFSYFFDTEHFITYWAEHSLTVTPWKTYRSCFSQSYLPLSPSNTPTTPHTHYLRNVSRIPEFFPIDLTQFIYFANTSSLKNTFSFPFDNHEYVTVEGRFGLTAMYPFWNDFLRLQQVHQSLQPSRFIALYVKLMLQQLPEEFIAINLRIDDIAFGNIAGKNNTNDARRGTEKLISYIEQHPCIQKHGKQSPIYLSTNVKPYVKMDRKRMKKLLEELQEKGFKNVKTRKMMMDLLILNRTTNAVKSKKSKIDESLLVLSEVEAVVSPEQLQFVDMLVSKRSVCLVPSLVPSLASYLIRRMKALDGGIEEKYEDVTPQSYGNMVFYRDWGL